MKTSGLRARNSDFGSEFPDVGSEPGDEGIEEDVALKRELYERALPIEHALEERLQDVNHALDKIDNGEYGVCEKCKKKISSERLKVLPETRTCKDCK